MILLALLVPVWGVHFYLSEGSEKCFLLDVPANTVIIGQYELLDPPADKDKGVAMKAMAPDGALLYHKLIRGAGKLSFTAQKQGTQRLCMFMTGSTWFSAGNKVRFELRLDTTNDEIDHSSLASQEEVEHLKDVTASITERLAEIIKQQDYAREKEAGFKDESEDMNNRVVWLTALQTLVILISGIWQIYSLRNFFKAKKLL